MPSLKARKQNKIKCWKIKCFPMIFICYSLCVWFWCIWICRLLLILPVLLIFFFIRSLYNSFFLVYFLFYVSCIFYVSCSFVFIFVLNVVYSKKERVSAFFFHFILSHFPFHPKNYYIPSCKEKKKTIYIYIYNNK